MLFYGTTRHEPQTLSHGFQSPDGDSMLFYLREPDAARKDGLLAEFARQEADVSIP